jgi:curved DNA-binding protein CbpA
MISGKTFYDVLGVAPQASQAEIVRVFREVVRERHPDRFVDPEKKREAELFLKEVTEAFNTLCRPHLRAKYDESIRESETKAVVKPAAEQVRELVQAGKIRQRQGDPAGALACFDHALRVEPENAEALFNAGMVRLKNPRWRGQGSLQVEAAIERDPFAVSYVTAYAQFLLENGQSLRAQRLLETSLETNRDEEKLLLLLDQCRGGKPGAGFSLFGKK